MTVIKWRDAYNTGVDQFDEEHHKLVELINTMYGAVRDGLGKEVVVKACEELVAYTGYHFSNEEQALAAINYPGLAEHKVEHDSLKAKTLDFQTRINAGLSDGGGVVSLSPQLAGGPYPGM